MSRETLACEHENRRILISKTHPSSLLSSRISKLELANGGDNGFAARVGPGSEGDGPVGVALVADRSTSGAVAGERRFVKICGVRRPLPGGIPAGVEGSNNDSVVGEGLDPEGIRGDS